MSTTATYEDLLARQQSEFSDDLLIAARRLRWSADRLADHREKRLRDILRWSIERSPFHRDRLAGTDVDRFTEADLPSLPTMTKTDLMADFEGIVTDPAVTFNLVNTHVDQLDADEYLLGQYRVLATSGTSGVRTLHVYGWEDWRDLALIASRWPGPEDLEPLGALTATMFATNGLHASGALYAFFKDLSREGRPAMLQLSSSLPVPEIVAGLNRAQPAAMRTYPSLVHLLALEARAGRLHIQPLHISTTGEQCTEVARRAVREAWGVEIRDFWSCTEGVYAFPCEAGRAMHLPDDFVIVEPADRDGQVVPAGVQADKIFITCLYRRAQPVIRYEITDSMKVLAGACACGSAHRRITDLAGRVEGFFIYEGGTAVHSLGLLTALLGFAGVAQFQVTQTPRGADVTLVTQGECDLEVVRLSIVGLMTKAGLREPRVNVAETASLDRLWSGKLRQFEPLG